MISLAKLNAKKRNALPSSDFGLPGKRAYPMPDKAHAANAKARASQMASKGILSTAAESQIDAKANRVLGKKPAAPTPKPKQSPRPKARMKPKSKPRAPASKRRS